jgi:hypothetical protein
MYWPCATGTTLTSRTIFNIYSFTPIATDRRSPNPHASILACTVTSLLRRMSTLTATAHPMPAKNKKEQLQHKRSVAAHCLRHIAYGPHMISTLPIHKTCIDAAGLDMEPGNKARRALEEQYAQSTGPGTGNGKHRTVLPACCCCCCTLKMSSGPYTNVTRRKSNADT